MSDDKTISEIFDTAALWAAAFNSGDAKGCASHYTADADMHAEPVAKVKGRDEIEKFWQGLIDDGFSDVKYLDPTVKVISDSVAELSSPWSMNKASGVIHLERWERQDDGKWLLARDHFQILDQQDN